MSSVDHSSDPLPDPVESLDFSLSPADDDEKSAEAPVPSSQQATEEYLKLLKTRLQLQDDVNREQREREEEAERQRLSSLIRSRQFHFQRSPETPLGDLEWARRPEAVHMKFSKKSRVLFISEAANRFALIAYSLTEKLHSSLIESFSIAFDAREEGKNKEFQTIEKFCAEQSAAGNLSFSAVVSLSEGANAYFLHEKSLGESSPLFPLFSSSPSLVHFFHPIGKEEEIPIFIQEFPELLSMGIE